MNKSTKSAIKQSYIKNHPLRFYTIKQLKRKAEKEGIFVYGDKAQILQCFDQSKYMSNLFKCGNKEKEN